MKCIGILRLSAASTGPVSPTECTKKTYEPPDIFAQSNPAPLSLIWFIGPKINEDIALEGG